MPIQLVNLGSSALAGNGDSLYSAFSKVNDNFNELYFLTQQALENAFTSTSTVVFDYGSFSAPNSPFPLQVRRGTNASRATIIPSQGELVYATDIKRLYIGDGVTPGGNVVLGTIGYTGSAGFGNTITNHLIPSVTGSYDLGSTSGQWRSLFVSSSTIFVNNTPVTVSNGQIIVNGNTVTGSLLFNQTQIIGDGDVSNLGSVQLVPNTLLTSNGQYVIVRPTIALDQTHIHMQAGNPDTADLYLGDDDRYVKIDHNGPVEIGAATGYLTAVFTSTSSVVDAATISIDKTANVWANELTFGDRIDIGTSSIYINTVSELEPSILTIFFTAGSLASYTTGTAITFTYKQRKTWKFQNNGGLTFPDGTTQTTAGGGGAANLGQFKISGNNLGTVNNPDTGGWGGHDMYIDPGNGSDAFIYIPGVTNQAAGINLQISNNSTGAAIQLFGRGGVQVVVNHGVNEKVFEFADNGDLIIPNAILGSGDQALVIQNTASGVAYLELPVNPSTNSVFLANQAASSATVTIRVGDFGSEKDWTFHNAGRIVFPNGTTSTGSTVYVPYATSSSFTVNTQIGQGPFTGQYRSFEVFPERIKLPSGNGYIQSGDNADLWRLDSGNKYFEFPNISRIHYGDGYYLSTGTLQVDVRDGGIFQIRLNDSNKIWTFDNNGDLTLPGGGAIQETQVTNELWGTTTTSLTLVPAGAANGTQRLEIYSTGGGEGDHIHIRSGDQSQTDLFLGNDTQYFAVAASGANYIQARSGAASTGSGVSAGAGANVNISAGSAGDNGGNVADGNSGGDVLIASGISTAGLGGDIFLQTSSGPTGFGSIKLSTDGGSSYLEFNEANQLVFPDNTIQTTAFVSNTIGFTYTISASGSSDYVFSGPGIHAGNENDPILYLYRGFTYKFINTTGGSHPFAIRVSNGGAAYTTGVSGSQTGTQTFTVPMDAPSTLYYQCTIHSGMGNTINIV